MRSIRWGIATCVLLCAGCTIDNKKVEGSIRTELAGKGVDLTSLQCPKGRSLKQGDKFDCDGVDTDGQHLVFHVEQTDAKGSINWKLDGMIINKAKVGDSIETTIGQSADVKCPEKSVILKVGESFDCDVVVAGSKHTVTLTLNDNSGNVGWKIH